MIELNRCNIFEQQESAECSMVVRMRSEGLGARNRVEMQYNCWLLFVM
jgi:hypothetical protein